MNFSKIAVTEGKVHLVRETKRDGTANAAAAASHQGDGAGQRWISAAQCIYCIFLRHLNSSSREPPILCETHLSIQESKQFPQGLGSSKVRWEDREKLSGEWSTCRIALNFPVLTACGYTVAFPIIPKFWNHRND